MAVTHDMYNHEVRCMQLKLFLSNDKVNNSIGVCSFRIKLTSPFSDEAGRRRCRAPGRRRIERKIIALGAQENSEAHTKS